MKLFGWALCQAKWSVFTPHSWRALACRTVYSDSGQWTPMLDTNCRKELEEYWRNKLTNDLKSSSSSNKGKYYVLSMFPYPSGRLHMGHVRVYTISDTMARYHRLCGKQVIHPMGWDAFGLPAENAAIERGELPDEWTQSNIETMKKQLNQLCCSFDWDREYSTCDPSYYKWTQWIFLKMHEAGLVYQKEALVNWDPVDQTVLANEQIDEEGRSWRSGVKAEKRYLKQWYIKTTAYAKSLYDGLSEVDPDLWKDVVALQKHWIGECNGCRLEFNIVNKHDETLFTESIFTRHPEGIYGISHILVSPEHKINEPGNYLASETDMTNDPGVIQLNVKAVHPFNGTFIPIFVSNTHEFGEFQDIHLGIPTFNEEDANFAVENQLHYINVLETSKHDESIKILVNSAQFSGLEPTEGFEAVATFAKKMGCGGDITSERLRDWLISRQRYWGTPIPMVHCPKKGSVPVAYEDLPVVLPKIAKFTGKGGSPLEQEQEWLKAKCQGCDCDGYGRRETDTMDTFVDSSWYFLRYLDPKNENLPCDPSVTEKLMPVDLYIGGKEHAVMHLYYARYFMHFLHDQGLVSHKEPFVNLLTQGMVMGQSHKVTGTGRYLRRDEVDFSGKKPVEMTTGAPVSTKWEKMSKSKYNGVDPQDVLDEFGVDTTRLCILSNVSPRSDRNWSHDVFKGVLRYQSRVWKLVTEFIKNKSDSSRSNQNQKEMNTHEEQIFEIRNLILKEVTYNFEQTFNLNAVISRLQQFTHELKNVPSDIQACSAEYERALCDLVIMLFPFAPLFASELWTGIASAPHKTAKWNYKWNEDVLCQSFPIVDQHYKLSLVVKKNLKDVFIIRLEHQDMMNLNKSVAQGMVEAHPDFTQVFSHHKILRSSFHYDPPYKAEFDIHVENNGKKKEG